jgi:transcriptional regulator with XRE-family HTH domain
MDQKELIDAAKQRQGLTSDYSLAQRLGITRSRMSLLQSGQLSADEAEIFMLADLAGIDARAAAAAVKKGKEKNPAKRAYWERISAKFSTAILVICVSVFTLPNGENSELREHFSAKELSINYTNI